jgi:hypothetical protein
MLLLPLLLPPLLLGWVGGDLGSSGVSDTLCIKALAMQAREASAPASRVSN